MDTTPSDTPGPTRFTPRPKARVRASSDTDLLSSIPYLLGYHPHASLVFLGLRDGRVGPTMRVDADAVRTEFVPCCSMLATMFTEQRIQRCVVVGYDPVGGAGPDDDLQQAELIGAVRSGLSDCGIEVLSAWQVGDCEWWSWDRPDERRPITDFDTTATRAELVLAGVNPASSRDRLGDAWTPYPSRVQRAILRHQHNAEAQPLPDLRREIVRVWGGVLGDGDAPLPERPRSIDPVRPFTDRDSALLLSGIDDGVIRDVMGYSVLAGCSAAKAVVETGRDSSRCLVEAMLSPGHAPSPDPDRLDLAVAALDHVVRCAIGPAGANALALLGEVHWWSGDGAKANLAVGRALALDPTCRLAQIMERLLLEAVPPAWCSRSGDRFGFGHEPKGERAS